MARRNAHYFRYGDSTQPETLFKRLQNGAQWFFDQFKIGAASGRKEAGYQGEKATDAVKEGVRTATNRAGEAGQKGADAVKEGATTASNRAAEAGQQASDKVKEEL